MGNVKKDVDKRIQHFVCGCRWYKELDEFTNHKYRHSVYYRICLVSGYLYQRNVITTKEFFNNVNALSWGEEKKYFLKCFLINVYDKKCPNWLARLLSFIKRSLFGKSR